MAEFKPRSLSHHAQLLASGEVVPMEVPAPRVFLHLASGDPYALDDLDRLVTGYLPLWLRNGVALYLRRDSGLGKIARRMARAVGTIAGLLGSPISAAVAEVVGFRLDRARAVVAAAEVAAGDPEIAARRLVAEIGPARVVRALEILEAGDGSEEAIAEAIRAAGGRPSGGAP